MLQKISISNECCSSEISISKWVDFFFIKVSTKILSSTTVFKIDNNNIIDNIYNITVLLYHHFYFSIIFY